MVVTQVDVTKRLIEEGLGVSFLPLSAVWRELQERRLWQVPTPGLELPTAATYVVAPARGLTPAAAALEAALRRRFGLTSVDAG